MSIDLSVVEVKTRQEKGKSAARRLRTQNLVPAVLYGGGKLSTTLAVQPEALRKALKTAHGMNTVLTLKFTDTNQSKMAMVKDWQKDVLGTELLHVDLVEISLDKAIRVNLPIHLTGKAKGVIEGGLMQMDRHELMVECLPSALPTHIDVDVSSLGIGHAIHVNELKLPAGVKAVFVRNFSIVGIVAPREDKASAQAAVTGDAAVAADAKAAAPTADKKAAPAAQKPAAKDAKK